MFENKWIFFKELILSIYLFFSFFITLQLNELKPENLSSETSNRAHFNAILLNENVKLDESNIIEPDKDLNNKQTVYLILKTNNKSKTLLFGVFIFFSSLF